VVACANDEGAAIGCLVDVTREISDQAVAGTGDGGVDGRGRAVALSEVVVSAGFAFEVAAAVGTGVGHGG